MHISDHVQKKMNTAANKPKAIQSESLISLLRISIIAANVNMAKADNKRRLWTCKVKSNTTKHQLRTINQTTSKLFADMAEKFLVFKGMYSYDVLTQEPIQSLTSRH